MLALFDEWHAAHPQPTAQLLEQTARLQNITETGGQMAATLTAITGAERTRLKGSWQIVISNQILTETLHTLGVWQRLTNTQ
jgi:hypothetical protein